MNTITAINYQTPVYTVNRSDLTFKRKMSSGRMVINAAVKTVLPTTAAAIAALGVTEPGIERAKRVNPELTEALLNAGYNEAATQVLVGQNGRNPGFAFRLSKLFAAKNKDNELSTPEEYQYLAKKFHEDRDVVTNIYDSFPQEPKSVYHILKAKDINPEFTEKKLQYGLNMPPEELHNYAELAIDYPEETFEISCVLTNNHIFDINLAKVIAPIYNEANEYYIDELIYGGFYHPGLKPNAETFLQILEDYKKNPKLVIDIMHTFENNGENSLEFITHTAVTIPHTFDYADEESTESYSNDTANAALAAAHLETALSKLKGYDEDYPKLSDLAETFKDDPETLERIIKDKRFKQALILADLYRQHPDEEVTDDMVLFVTDPLRKYFV